LQKKEFIEKIIKEFIEEFINANLFLMELNVTKDNVVINYLLEKD